MTHNSNDWVHYKRVGDGVRLSDKTVVVIGISKDLGPNRAPRLKKGATGAVRVEVANECGIEL